MRGNKPVPVSTVTLALTPEQSERLALAQTEGKLMLATRNLVDEQIVQTSGTNVNKLLNNSPAPRKKVSSGRVAQKSQPRSYTVSVLHGNQMTEHHFVEKGDQQWVEQGQ
jgi:pilus assembly protein CpaB